MGLEDGDEGAVGGGGKWRNYSRDVWIFQSVLKTKETLSYISYSALVESQ